MKKWNKPKVTTIKEKDLKSIIIAGACSTFDCTSGWWRQATSDK